ncbi:MAG: lysine--tRNA ligase [Candidatus Andersenbacteria bacterium]
MAKMRLEEMRQARLTKREELLASGAVPYPTEVRRSHTASELTDQFEQLQSDNTPVTVWGRVTALRKHGGLAFLDLTDSSGTFQLQLMKDDAAEEIFTRLESIDTGDWIQAAGDVTTTKRGTQTLAVSEFHIISKAIRPLPDSWYGLKDHETRYRQREVDLLMNDHVRQTFMTRSRIVTWLRQYLTDQQFLEVETPILQPIAGGAAAQPFHTHHNTLDMNLFLRIAPELYLKRLIVGGFEKVFEIGRNFRNEGISKQHNPEFTMLEFYWAGADYEDLMDMTEQMISKLAQEVVGSGQVSWQEQSLNFSAPFERKRYVEVVSERIGVDILEEKDPNVYLAIFEREGIEVPEAHNYMKLVDELYKELVRPSLLQPTLLYDYPFEMVPLAKRSPHDPRIAEKFQLLIAGTEIVNAYTEQNDPVEQRQRFEEQQRAREEGDAEAQAVDEAYLRAMEYGMPPTAGFGLGVDRLTMLLTDSPTLRDTILFPLLRPEL